MSSPLTKIGITYTQVLWEEKIFQDQSGQLNGAWNTEMLRNLNERLGAKYLVTTLSYSMVKIAHLDDAFSEIFELEASPVGGQSL